MGVNTSKSDLDKKLDNPEFKKTVQDVFQKASASTTVASKNAAFAKINYINIDTDKIEEIYKQSKIAESSNANVFAQLVEAIKNDIIKLKSIKSTEQFKNTKSFKNTNKSNSLLILIILVLIIVFVYRNQDFI